ncbi:hypothetical protein Tco_0966243 [Tanacetum coccineum]
MGHFILSLVNVDVFWFNTLIHKFAVRFATLYETERFINFVKEFFGHEKIDGSMSGISITRTSSQSEIIPRAPHDWDPISSSANFSQPMYRAPQDWDPISSSADVSQPIYRPPQNEDLVNSSADFSQPMYRPPQNEDPVNSSAYFSQPMYSQISNPLEATLSQDVQGKLSAFPLSFTSLLMDGFPTAEQEMLSKVQKVVNGFEDDLRMQPVTTL